MNITRVRYFIAVAEAEHVGRAARTLNVAQPALSKQLQTLEREAGTQLFERHARGVQLTAAGNAFLPHAREMVKAADAGLAAARIASVPHAAVRIATPDWPHRSVIVAAAIAEMNESHPGVDFEYSAISSTISDRALRSGEIDVGFGLAPSPAQFGRDLVAVPWVPEPGLSALLSARHPLARRVSLRLRELKDTPALVPPRADVPALHDQMVAVIRSGGFEPKIVTCPLNFTAGAQMAAVGAGWILTVHSIAESPPPGTVVIPLDDTHLHLDLYVLHRANDRRPCVAAFVEHLRANGERGRRSQSTALARSDSASGPSMNSVPARPN